MAARFYPRAGPLSSLGHFLAHLIKARGGVAAIELAFILPTLLTFLLGIVEFGRLLWTQSTLQFAVEAAARCAAVNTTTCASTSEIQTYAASQAFGLSIPSSSFNVSNPSCGNNVAITYSFGFVVPKLLPWTITLNAQSCHP